MRALPSQRRYPFIAVLLLGLCACSQDDATAPVPPDRGSARIDAAGGSVQTTTSDGFGVRLELAPGAVLQPIDLTVAPVAPLTGERARFRVAAPTLLLLEPATLRLRLPDSEVSSALDVLIETGGDPVPVPAQPDGSELVVQLHRLGRSTTDAVPKENGTGMDVVLAELDCTLEVSALHDRIEQIQAYMTADQAPSVLGDQVVSLLQRLEAVRARCANGFDVESEVAYLRQVACETYESAATDVQVVTPPDNVDDFIEQMMRPLAGAAMVAASGADCGPAIEQLAGEEADDFVSRYADRVTAPGYVDGLGPWAAMWGELRSLVQDFGVSVAMLGLDSVEGDLYGGLLPAMSRVYRQVAYQSCREDGEQSRMVDLMTSGWSRGLPLHAAPEPAPWMGFGYDEVLADVQQCGTGLELAVFDAVSDPVSTVTLGGGDGYGQHVDEAQVAVPFDGFIDLIGPVRALLCQPPGGSASFADDRLELRIDDEPQAIFDPVQGDLLATPHDLSMATILEEHGLPQEAGHSLLLTVHRRSDACDGMYGPTDYRLAAIELITVDGTCVFKTDCQNLVLEFDLPTELEPGEPHDMWVSAYYEDHTGDFLSEAGNEVSISFSATGGSVVPGSVTPEDGEARITVTMDEDADELVLEGIATGAGGDSARWSDRAINPERVPIRLTRHHVRMWHQLSGESVYYADRHVPDGAAEFTRNRSKSGADENGSFTTACSLRVESVPSYGDDGALEGLSASATIRATGSGEGNGTAHGQAQVWLTIQVTRGSWALEIDGRVFGSDWDSQNGRTARGTYVPDGDGDAAVVSDDGSDRTIASSVVLGPGEYALFIVANVRGYTGLAGTFDLRSEFELDIVVTPQDAATMAVGRSGRW